MQSYKIFIGAIVLIALQLTLHNSTISVRNIYMGGIHCNQLWPVDLHQQAY